MVAYAGEGPVALAVGEDLLLRLPENATTGYVWRVSQTPPVLQPATRSAAQVPEPNPAPEPGAPGAGREHVFCFHAIAPGSGVLRLQLARAWEHDPLEQRDILVRVEPAG